MNRAARAPDTRRGSMRRGPKPPRSKEATGAAEDARGDDTRRGRPDRRPIGGAPRVITVESDRVQETSRGHKGELRSLASLKSLLSPRPDDRPQEDQPSE